MTEKLKKQEWDLLIGIRILCEKYIACDKSAFGFRGNCLSAQPRKLESYMAFVYKCATDATICKALHITPGTATPHELEEAMFRWLCSWRFYTHRTTKDGLHLFFADLSEYGAEWHSLLFMFREKWLESVSQRDEINEHYMSDFLEGIYRYCSE